MSKLLRYFKPGQIYFVTSVTHNRQLLLKDHCDTLSEILDKYKLEMRFDLIAWVIMPDHLHIIIDPKDNSLSDIMRKIKLSFSFRFRKSKGIFAKTIWQKRFWDHIIRNQNDLNRCIDYIHYNPVKHGIVMNPEAWKHSSFQLFLGNGYYTSDWGSTLPRSLGKNENIYGE